MAYEQIIYTKGNRVATITLNRPDRLNAWTRLMAEEIRDAMYCAVKDEAVRVIVLTGARRGFCAGADMAELETASDHGVPYLDDTMTPEQRVSVLTGTKMEEEREAWDVVQFDELE